MTLPEEVREELAESFLGAQKLWLGSHQETAYGALKDSILDTPGSPLLADSTKKDLRSRWLRKVSDYKYTHKGRK